MRKRNIIFSVLVVAFLLSAVLVGMQFTDEIVWTLGDFVFAGIILLGTGLAYEFVASRGGNPAYRAAVGVALATALILVWVNAAVGVIGDDNPVNLMYFGVIAVGLIGAFFVHLESRGMVRVLFVTAFAQILVPVIALVISDPQITSWSPGVAAVFGLNALFAILFIGSGLLFQQASVKSLK